MAKNTDLKELEKTATRLGRETHLKGTLRFTDSVMISGTYEGRIESSGFLYIEVGAVVRADIRVRSIVIGGVVHGNIEATENLEMLPSGQVYGNVRTSKLKIADGVTFEGKCEMLRNADSIDIFSVPAGQLKKTLQNA